MVTMEVGRARRDAAVVSSDHRTLPSSPTGPEEFSYASSSSSARQTGPEERRKSGAEVRDSCFRLDTGARGGRNAAVVACVGSGAVGSGSSPSPRASSAPKLEMVLAPSSSAVSAALLTTAWIIVIIGQAVDLSDQRVFPN